MDRENEKIQKCSQNYWKALLALFFGSIVAFGAEYCVQPIIPVLAEAFDLTPAKASLAVSFGTGGMAFSMLLIASFAKHLERRKVMAIALVGSAILAFIMAVSESFGLILVLRLCQGILLAGFPAMAVAYINEEFDAGIIGAVVGIYVSGSSVGGLLGRMLLSILTDFFSWRIALGTLAVLYAVIGICFFLLLPKAKYVREKIIGNRSGVAEFKRLLSNHQLVGVYFIALAIMGSFVCTYNFISYVLLAPPYSLSQTMVGFIFMLYFLGTIASTVMGGLTDRIGNGPVLCISIFCMLTGSLVSLFTSLFLKLIGLGIFTYGFFGAHSAACGWAGRLDRGDKAQISALYMLFYYIGASVIGTVGGTFLSIYGWTGIVGFLSAVLLFALFIAFWLTKKQRSETVENEVVHSYR